MDRPGGGGFRPETISNVMIALGERRELDFDLAVEAVAEVVKVTVEANPLISPDRMGSSQEIPEAVSSLSGQL